MLVESPPDANEVWNYRVDVADNHLWQERGPDEGDDGHGYYPMLRRGLSMHRDDCAPVGQPDQRFWKGPFSREEAIRQADRVPATFILRVCKGDCTAEETEWLLDSDGMKVGLKAEAHAVG